MTKSKNVVQLTVEQRQALAAFDKYAKAQQKTTTGWKNHTKAAAAASAATRKVGTDAVSAGQKFGTAFGERGLRTLVKYAAGYATISKTRNNHPSNICNLVVYLPFYFFTLVLFSRIPILSRNLSNFSILLSPI